MHTLVKKWFRDEDFGFLENGSGPDIKACKIDLVNCQFLKKGATVEFECHIDEQGLTAKKIKLVRQDKLRNPKNKNPGGKQSPFGVMT